MAKNSWARAFCACGRCGWGLFGHFSLVYLFSYSLSSKRPDILKYCLKGPLNKSTKVNKSIEQSVINLHEGLNGHLGIISRTHWDTQNTWLLGESLILYYILYKEPK